MTNFEESYTYNDFGERSTSSTTKNGAEIYKNSYTYDNLGRIKTITEVREENSQLKSYEYDLIGRITEVKIDNIITETYSYDENGNRLTSHDVAEGEATYDLEDRMLTYGENSYTYNEKGTLLTKTNTSGVTTYVYDSYDTLKSVTLPDNRVISYETDVYDRRVIKKVDGVITKRYVYQDELNISQELDADGNIETQYIYGLKSNVPEYMIRSGIKYKIISDHLGSPVMIVNTRDDSVVKSIKYDTFGNIISDSNESFNLPFRFAGGIWDKDTKLIRFGVRDYDSLTGRWLSKEPLGFSATNNFYAYCDNKPVNFVDLDGNLVIAWYWIVPPLAAAVYKFYKSTTRAGKERDKAIKAKTNKYNILNDYAKNKGNRNDNINKWKKAKKEYKEATEQMLDDCATGVSVFYGSSSPLNPYFGELVTKMSEYDSYNYNPEYFNSQYSNMFSPDSASSFYSHDLSGGFVNPIPIDNWWW